MSVKTGSVKVGRAAEGETLEEEDVLPELVVLVLNRDTVLGRRDIGVAEP
jgi:hypothetical protein